jgi:hypothetical protein
MRTLRFISCEDVMACPAELEAASEATVHYGDSESLKSVHDCWAKRLWAES